MKKTADSTIETAEGLLAEGEEADTGMSQLKTKADEALLQSQQAVQECAELINGGYICKLCSNMWIGNDVEMGLIEVDITVRERTGEAWVVAYFTP